MSMVFRNYLIYSGYALVGSIAMSVSLFILIKVWNFITPIDEWEELKKGNIAVAIVMSAVILAFALVVCFSIMPGQ